MMEFSQPAWMKPYTSGQRSGGAAALHSYSAYYCVDGSADEDPEIEERLPVHRTPMIPYASRTGTKRNLEGMRENGWHVLVSAKGVLRTENLPYAIDNGAWSAYTQGEPFDEYAFAKAFDLLGENAKWVALPDIVMGGMRSLDLSLRWLERLRGSPTKLLLCVQDGMTPDIVRAHVELSPSLGIFVGGSTAFKVATVHSWGVLARRRNCHLHVGRVNSAKRIELCAKAGAHSIDGTSASMFAKTIPRLSAAVARAESQLDFLTPNGQDFADTPYDCAWPSDF